MSKRRKSYNSADALYHWEERQLEPPDDESEEDDYHPERDYEPPDGY